MGGRENTFFHWVQVPNGKNCCFPSQMQAAKHELGRCQCAVDLTETNPNPNPNPSRVHLLAYAMYTTNNNKNVGNLTLFDNLCKVHFV